MTIVNEIIPNAHLLENEKDLYECIKYGYSIEEMVEIYEVCKKEIDPSKILNLTPDELFQRLGIKIEPYTKEKIKNKIFNPWKSISEYEIKINFKNGIRTITALNLTPTEWEGWYTWEDFKSSIESFKNFSDDDRSGHNHADTGLYAIINLENDEDQISVFDPRVEYIGETSSVYGPYKKSGIDKRISMVRADMLGQPGSNHKGKFFTKLGENFNIGKIRYAFLSHPEDVKFDEQYSRDQEEKYLEEFKRLHGRYPKYNVNGR